MKKKKFLSLLIALALAAFAAAAGAQKTPTIRIGLPGISGSNAYPYVSKQLGLFAKYNVDVDIVVFQAGVQVIQAMLAGDLPLGIVDGPPMLAANLRGGNLVAIAGNVNTFPYTIISKSEIRAPAELKGKKIGISRYGSSSDTAVRVALEKHNLKPDKEVVILQIGGQSERFAALKAGVVDATIVSPPFNMVARRLGFKDLIDISESGIAYAHLQTIARRDFLERNPDQVLRFLKGEIEGTSYWKDPSKKEAVLKILAKFLKLDMEKDKDQLDETFRYYGKIFPSRPYPSMEGMEYAAELVKKTMPDAKIQAKDWVSNRYVEELEKEGFLAHLYGYEKK